MLINALKAEAIRRSVWMHDDPDQMTPEDAFFLVRDMPYKRASNREPSTTINEWRGTCSGKHYLLKALF